MVTLSYEKAQREIVDIGHWVDSRGWVPATGGNLSIRLADGTVAITVSGRHKGDLCADDIMRVDMEGKSLDGKKPSAETLLHTGLYKTRPDVDAVVHTHPRQAIAYTIIFKDQKNVRLSGYELLKIFPGVKTHETTVTLPIFENTQDMVALQKEVDAWYKEHPETPPVYLVRGHGLTAGAKDILYARYITEAVEEMIAYELERARFGAHSQP